MQRSQTVLYSVIVALVLCVVVSNVAHAHVAVDPAYLSGLGLKEGDVIGSTNTADPDIYIVNAWGFKRLFISPAIFGYYGHLGFAQVKRFADTVLESFDTSAYFRNCETNDPKVYALEATGEDRGALHWMNLPGDQALAQDSYFFQKIFCINTREFNSYAQGTAYTSIAQVPVYSRALTPGQGINQTNLPLTLPPGTSISLFTPSAIGPLRFMAFSPDGILFVSMPSSAGLYGSGPNDGAVFAFPDRDHNGVADETIKVLSGLRLPHGLAFHNGFLYVAQEGSVARYPYLNDGKVGARQVIVPNLPTGGEHLSRTIVFGTNGKMYVSIGSSCNDCANTTTGTADVWEYNDDGTGGRVFAHGLRNSVGLAFDPSTGALWGTENGRDFLGDDLPPDEINILHDGGDYGWPKCYGAQVPDPAYNDAAFCATTVPAVHNLQAHSAPLGLAFVTGTQFSQWAGDLIVARHGSWNRTVPVGYDVVRLHVQGDTVVSESPFITGWLTSRNSKLGRPVDVIFGPDGALYISDDQANVIYRVTKTP